MIYTKSVPRKWSKEEENKVIELKKQGKSNLEIAKIMDRTEVAIQIKLKRLTKKNDTYNSKHRKEKYSLNTQFLEIIKPKSILDVFSGSQFYDKNKYDVITNDKDKKFNTDYNLDYLEFLCLMYYEKRSFDLVDLDPYGSAYDGFDLAIKMANKGLIITLGEIGHQRWKRLDFVERYYNITNLNDFTTNNLIEHIKKIGYKNKKELKPHFILEANNIARVYFIIEEYKITSQWEKKEDKRLNIFDFMEEELK